MKKKEFFQAAIVLFIAAFLTNALIPFVVGSEKPLIVQSGSMTPLMLPGDMIIVKSTDSNELKIGDVIAFHPPGGKPDSLVTHRIISLEEGKNRLFQTKGDANNAKDGFKVPASNTVGKLIFVIPFAGYLPEIFKYKKIAFFTVVLPAGLVILDEIKNLILYSNQARARKIERERKKTAMRTSYMIERKRLAAFILISGLIFTGIVAHNLGENGPLVLQKENRVENPGFLPLVYVFTTDYSENKFDINSWYGVISPINTTMVTAVKNTPSKISSVPYIMPVFWIIALTEISPYLPAAAEIVTYAMVFTLLFFPFWYKKSTVVGSRKRIRLNRLFAKWKRILRIG